MVEESQESTVTCGPSLCSKRKSGVDHPGRAGSQDEGQHDECQGKAACSRSGSSWNKSKTATKRSKKREKLGRCAERRHD